MLLDIATILKTVRRYQTYEVYPYIYFVDRYDSIVDVPSRENTKIETWIIPFTDGVGLVVHRINDLDVILRGYEITDTVREDDSIVERVQRLINLINKQDIAGSRIERLNKHVISGIAVALGLEREEVEKTIRGAILRTYLEDRNVVIFDDIVILLSRRKFMIRYDGADAVDIARKYSFVVGAPISYIAESFIPKILGNSVAVFIFPDASIICNPVTCYNMPLPSNIALLIAKRIPGKHVAIVDLERNPPEQHRRLKLPIPPICIAKNKLLMLKPEGKERYRVVEAWKTRVRPVAPLVFTKYGFIGYAKVLTRENRIYVEVKRMTREKHEEETDKYLEEVVLGS